MTPTDWMVDCVIAAGAFGFGLLQLTLSANLFIPDDFTRRLLGIQAVTPSAMAIVSTLLLSAPLIWRRRLPWVVFALDALMWILMVSFSRLDSLLMIAPLIALFTVAYERGRGEAIGSTCAMLAIVLVSALRGPGSGLSTLLAFQNASLVIAIGLAGYAMYARQQVADAAVSRADAAERLRLSETMRAEAAERLQASETKRAVEAERTRETEASRRVEEERVRIARELHDITAHSLSAVSIQAAAAERLVDTDAQAAKAAISEVRSIAKGALADMRSMVGVLRSGEEAELVPTEGTERIASLVDYLHGADVASKLDVAGYDKAKVPTHVDVALFGIAREAVTNVVRHAGAHHVSIALACSDGSCRLQVCDDGRGIGNGIASDAVNRTRGHGIEGMRERVKLLDGTFSIEESESGGTCIDVTIPLRG